MLAAIAALFCSTSLSAQTGRGRREENREREERREEQERKRKAALPESKGTPIVLEAAEFAQDTVRFHIGSPLFLRLRIPQGNSACKPFNGKPFFFDANGVQLGWSFEEVTDSLLFPSVTKDCERILMLSSDASNRLPEGYYTLNVAILFDAGTRMTSNTIVMHPEYSHGGADTLSYSRFLQEQIIRNNPLLHDPETLKALFAQGVPESPASEICRALVLLRTGDVTGAQSALASASVMESQRGVPPAASLAARRDAIEKAIQTASAHR